MKRELYVAVDIGCIECGEESSVLGVFVNKKDAEKVIADAAKRQRENWTGQHSFEIFKAELEIE
jgi:hypothetical protein